LLVALGVLGAVMRKTYNEGQKAPSGIETSRVSRLGLSLGVSLAALCATTTISLAGGYAVREQSASLLGSAFAGAAAGVDLSSAYWNPAAFGIAKSGISVESHYSLITANTELSNGVSGVSIGGATSTEIDELGYLASTYAAYRLNEKMVLGISSGAPFGLKTNPDDENWAGRFYGRGADMLTFNVSPTLAYEIAPGVHVAAGLQLQHMRLKLWTGNPLEIGNVLTQDDPANLKVNISDDVGVGFTLGILLQPTQSTSIGLGFRSKIKQELEGKAYIGGSLISQNVKADLETPEIVTLSISQAISHDVRLLGTVEWTNWSRLSVVDVTGLLPPPAGAAVVANWDDGWFFSAGLEYDYSPALTLRGGIAYEISPIQDATQRLLPLPDTDRVWLSAGASYQYSETTSFDFGYSHVFFEDGDIDRGLLADPKEEGPRFTADVENSANIFSVGMKSKLDWLLSGG
jgi:long-chain fatty acid transport protein